jgi:hypothetical protein
MAEYGHFVHLPAEPGTAVAALLGRPLDAVRSVRWRGAVVGLRLEAEGTAVVLVNNGDDVFVSRGELPPDYLDAVVDP